MNPDYQTHFKLIWKLFLKYGVTSVSMDDIAKELGVSKKTLYQYSENKVDIIYQITSDQIEKEYFMLEKVISLHQNAIDQLVIMCRHTINKLRNQRFSLIYYGIKKYHPQIHEKLNVQRKEYFITLLKQNYLTGVEQGIYRENLNADIINILYTSMLDIKGLEIYKDLLLNNGFRTIINVLLRYHLSAIANDRGIECLEKRNLSIKKKICQ